MELCLNGREADPIQIIPATTDESTREIVVSNMLVKRSPINVQMHFSVPVDLSRLGVV